MVTTVALNELNSAHPVRTRCGTIGQLHLPCTVVLYRDVYGCPRLYHSQLHPVCWEQEIQIGRPRHGAHPPGLGKSGMRRYLVGTSGFSVEKLAISQFTEIAKPGARPVVLVWVTSDCRPGRDDTADNTTYHHLSLWQWR